ncbi:MAG: DNA gyrase inhibitor YacG [Deltaproteobacteria bacterium]
MRVKCPRCSTSVEWVGNRWRPFCSERCKMIDLGAWAEGQYKIPTEETGSSERSNGNSEEEEY